MTDRGLWLTFLPPFGLEVAERAAAIDWIGVDLQHGDIDLADLAPLARASALPVYARSASHDPSELGRILDCGVAGIIVPAVESGQDAAALANAVLLPPRGRRSSGAARASLLGGDPPRLLAMIETATGLAAAAEIAAVPGVDGLFVGPYDLALSLGETSVSSPRTIAAICDVVAAARRHGRLVGVFAGNAHLAAQLPPLDLVGVDSDVTALRTGLVELFGPAITRTNPTRTRTP